MGLIEFTADEREFLARKIQLFLASELDCDVGRFDAESVLDFVASEIGPHIYNRGLYDARAVLESRLEVISDAIYELEKVTDLSK